MKEIEGRAFIFPELGFQERKLSTEQILRSRVEKVAVASETWWIKSNFIAEHLGGIDYVHTTKTPLDIGVTSSDFPNVLKNLMEEYGVSPEPLSTRETDLSQIRGFADIGYLFEHRTYPTRVPGLAFKSVTQLDKETGKTMHVWWYTKVVVPGTLMSQKEKERIGKRLIRLKSQEQPTTFTEVTGFWWNYEGLARVSGEVASRLLQEFSQADESEKRLLVAQFENEIKAKREYPCELTINQETGMTLLFDETLLNFAIFQDGTTGEFLLHKPKFKRPKVIKPPIEIENFPYLSIVGGSEVEIERRDDIIRHIARMTTGFERRRFAKIPGVLEFAKEPFLQGHGPIEIEAPVLKLSSMNIEKPRGRIEMTPKVDPEWWRGEIAKKFEEEMREVVRRVVSREVRPHVLSETIDKFIERVDRLDPKGYEALFDNPELVPQYSKLVACYELWEHWWHDLGREDFPVPDTEERLLGGKSWEELGEEERK